MINIIFLDKDLEQLYEFGKCSNRTYNILSRDKSFMTALHRIIQTMRDCENVDEFRQHSILHYEKLRGRAESSARIMNSRVERLIFRENKNGIEILIIELNTTHYGNKK